MANSSQLSETISDSPFIIFQPFDSLKINKKSYKFFLNVNAKIISKTVCFFLVSQALIVLPEQKDLFLFKITSLFK